MSTTELTLPAQAAAAAKASRGAGSARPDLPVASPEPPTIADMIDDVLPLINVVFVAGPPITFLAGPGLLLALMLMGPFALLVTFVVLAAALGAIAFTALAIPFLIIRHLHGRLARRAAVRTRATLLVPSETSRALRNRPAFHSLAPDSGHADRT